MNRLLTRAMVSVVLMVVAAWTWLPAQTSSPQKKGSTKVFGLPVAKSDTTAPKGSTAAAVENRTDTISATKTSEADLRTNWGSVVKIFVAIEGTKQGKFKATPRGAGPEFECLTYLLQPQSGAGHRPSITITRESDAATSQFLQALETGEPLKTVTFEFLEGIGGKTLSKATLTGASIVALQQHFDAKTRGVFEDITLNFTKIEYSR